MTIEQMAEKLRNNVEERRFAHSVSVMEEAVRLAKHYGADVEKARIAGLLHDCAKNFPKEKLYALCDEYNVKLDNISKQEVKLLHGFVGANILKSEYGVDDEEIFDAVYYHTIGKPNMSLLTKIIFIADCIEPTRESNWADQVRDVVYDDIDKALIVQLDNTIKCVLAKGSMLHTNTVNTRNFYIENTR